MNNPPPTRRATLENWVLIALALTLLVADYALIISSTAPAPKVIKVIDSEGTTLR